MWPLQGTSTESGQDDKSTRKGNNTNDESMVQALGAFPFYVIQDRETGEFKDYIIDRKEDPKNADIKRSLFKDLNPVIDVQPSGQRKARAGARGEILFRLMERDMNGRHHNVYMLKRHVGGQGIHEVQHIRSFMLDDAADRVDDIKESGDKHSGVASQVDPTDDEDTDDIEEPAACPYKVEDITESAGKHSRTVTTEGDAVEKSKDEGELGIGKEPEDSEDMPSENAADDAQASG